MLLKTLPSSLVLGHTSLLPLTCTLPDSVSGNGACRLGATVSGEEVQLGPFT